jgi:hypothetical protein
MRRRTPPGIKAKPAAGRKRRAAIQEQATAHEARQLACSEALSRIGVSVGGLNPEAVIPAPGAEGFELVVEVRFAGPRSGAVSIGLSRGLTRQIGKTMAAVVDLEGRPVSAIEAAKEFGVAITNDLLTVLFGLDVRFRISEVNAGSPRPLRGEVVIAQRFAEGFVALSAEFGL